MLQVRGSQGIRKYPNVLFSRINFIDLFTNFLCIKSQVVALRLGFGFVKSGVIYRFFLLAMLERIYGSVYLVLANFLASMASFLNLHKTTDF